MNSPNAARHLLTAPSSRVSHPPAPPDDFADDLESYMVALESSACEGEAQAIKKALEM